MKANPSKGGDAKPRVCFSEPTTDMMAGLPKTDFEKRAVWKQVG
jgi:hypothetical protein